MLRKLQNDFSSLAAELAALNVNVLVAVTRIAALAAQRATTTIPIVFVAIPDPVGSKLVASLAHPGGNITGLSNFAHDLTAKRVEFLKTIVPSVSRVALLMNPNDRDSARIYVEEGQAAADKLDLMLKPIEIRSPDDLVPAFSKMRDDQVDGVVEAQDGLFFTRRKDIADLTLAQKLPLVVYSRETVEAGALASYGPDNYGLFRRSGSSRARSRPICLSSNLQNSSSSSTARPPGCSASRSRKLCLWPPTT